VLESYGKAVKLDLPQSMLCRRTWNLSYIKKFEPNVSGFSRNAADWELTSSDIIDADQSMAETDLRVSNQPSMIVTDLHFEKMSRNGRLFKVQFNHSWSTSGVYLEKDLSSLHNGLDVLNQWIAEKSARIK
jgi:hypothetical protein